MTHQIWKNWSYVLLPGKHPDPEFLNYYHAAYELWSDVWHETLSSLDGIERLHSDEFTRQDCVGAVFDGSTCLMLSFFRHVDLSISANRNDSYFRHWSNEAIQALTRDSEHILVASHVTLSAPVRRGFHGISMKDLMLNLLVEYGKHTHASAESGTTRNNKGMNRVAVAAGASLIQSGVSIHGLESDIYAFYMKDLRSYINQWTPIVKDLWRRRVVVDSRHSRSTELSREAA